MQEYNRKQLDEFFAGIENNIPAYKHCTFSYLALKTGNTYRLLQGQILLLGTSAGTPSKQFESETIRAEICYLEQLQLSPKLLIDNLLSGFLKLPSVDLHFVPEGNHGFSVNFTPFSSDGIPYLQRQSRLYIGGGRRERIDLKKMDWELKSSSTPYDTLQELCTDHLVGTLNSDAAAVEVIAFNVAAVSVDSNINGTRATIGINLAHGLDRTKSSIGYRLFKGGVVVKRSSISADTFSWRDQAQFQHGETEMDVPAGAILHCIACYNGCAQHHQWIADPTTAQNPFRAVHQAFDSNLDVLGELVSNAQSRKANARDLEIAVSWVLWMLGFSTTHIGGTSKTSESPDLIAATPNGSLMVIECTTGILKEGSKLALLCQRAEKVRQTLVTSGNQHLKVLPVIITTKTKKEIESELDQAHKLGVLVVTIENFTDALQRTHLVPDANRLYAEAEKTLFRLQNPSPFGLSGVG